MYTELSGNSYLGSLHGHEVNIIIAEGATISQGSLRNEESRIASVCLCRRSKMQPLK